MAEIDVPDPNFLPLPLPSGLLLQIYGCPLLWKLNSTLFRTTVLRHSPLPPFIALPGMTFPSITFEWLIISVWIFVSFWISYFEYSELFSNLSTCVLVGCGYKIGFEPRLDKICIVRVWLKSNNVFIQHLMVF